MDDGSKFYEYFNALPKIAIDLYVMDPHCADCTRANTSKCLMLSSSVFDKACATDFRPTLKFQIANEVAVMRTLET
jgi:hypothetical protein